MLEGSSNQSFEIRYNDAKKAYKNGDIKYAISILLECVKEKHISSILLLAKIYEKEKLVDKSFELVKLAYDLGSDEAIDNLGRCYYLGIGTEINYQKAIELFYLANEKKVITAPYHIALCYALGHGVKKDVGIAFTYYKQGEKYNDPRCVYNIAKYYEHGIYVGQNQEMANLYYQKAKTLGLIEK